MKKTLIIECWYGHPEDNWYHWLKKELEKKGYEVYVPDLPTMDTSLPDMKKQLEFIEKTVKINKDTIVFGHSLGALLAMRLAEKHTFSKLFLVAGWDFNDLTREHKLFWKTKINHSKIKKNVKDIICISSDNDPFITAITAEDMSKRLGGKFLLIKGARHFSEKLGGITKIPELLEYL
jgi:predicted alpha/beta hydrolase family esterase